MVVPVKACFRLFRDRGQAAASPGLARAHWMRQPRALHAMHRSHCAPVHMVLVLILGITIYGRITLDSTPLLDGARIDPRYPRVGLSPVLQQLPIDLQSRYG